MRGWMIAGIGLVLCVGALAVWSATASVRSDALGCLRTLSGLSERRPGLVTDARTTFVCPTDVIPPGAGRGSYAVRDTTAHPIDDEQRATSIVAACAACDHDDNGHAAGVPVVYADGRGRVIPWAELGVPESAAERRTQGARLIGRGSSHPELAKLTPVPADLYE